ncbi:MAG: phage distal tail protein [Stackebrandtia sp.]
MDEGQVSVNGLVMGRDTSYRVNEFNPWNRAIRAEATGANPWSDGGWSGAEFYEPVTVEFKVRTQGANATDWQQLHWQLTQAFAPIRTALTEYELRWVTAGVEYLMYGRPRSLSPTVARLRTGQVAETASFYCPDPAIYSGAEHVVTIGLPDWTGGLTVPVVTPATVAATQTDGVATVTNAGNVAARLLLRITGPVTDPSVTVIDTDGIALTLTIETTLGPDDWIDVDTAERSVILNGSVSRLADAWGSWPLLYPGTSTIRYAAADHNDLTRLTIRWRDQW